MHAHWSFLFLSQSMSWYIVTFLFTCRDSIGDQKMSLSQRIENIIMEQMKIASEQMKVANEAGIKLE